MTEHAKKSVPPGVAGWCLIILGGLLLLSGIAYASLTPRVYKATAKVRAEIRGYRNSERNAGQGRTISESFEMTSEYKLLRSDAFVDEVIDNLGLRSTWKPEDNRNGTPDTNEIRALFRSRVRTDPIPSTSIFEIEATSDKREEPALIANEVARMYIKHHSEEGSRMRQKLWDDLRSQWDQKSKEVEKARGKLEQVKLNIESNQASSRVLVYDPQSYRLMKADQARLETDFITASNDYRALKATDAATLRGILPGMVTNAVLDNAIDSLRAAKRDFESNKVSEPPDSPALKKSAALLNLAETRVDQLVKGILVARNADLETRKTLLEDVNNRLRHATTNTSLLLTNSPAFVAAADKFKKEDAELESLKSTMDLQIAEPLLPMMFTVELTDRAETPAKPLSPNLDVAFTVSCSGGVGVIVGLLMLVAQRSKASTPASAAPANSREGS